MYSIVEDLGFLLLVSGLLTSFIFAAIGCFWRNEFLKYIKETNLEWWKKLTAWPMSKITELEESEEDTTDPIVNLYRMRFQKCRKLLVIAVVIFFAGLVLLWLVPVTS